MACPAANSSPRAREACAGSGPIVIDILQMHGWDGTVPLEETLSAFDTLVTGGKVRYVGVSNWSAWHLMKALGVSERDGLPRFVCQQIYYSLQAREAEYELVPVALDQGVGILVWSPLAGALLTGRWRRGQPPPTRTRRMRGWPDPPIYDEEKLWATIDVLVEWRTHDGCGVPEVALAYLLHKPGVVSLLIVLAPTESARRERAGCRADARRGRDAAA